MKIRCNRKDLASTLAWVAQAVPKKVNVPALSGLALRADDGRLTVQGFDYEVSHQATIDVEVLEAGACLAPAAFLVTFVGQMRGDTVELVLDDETLTLTAGRSSYRTRTLRIEDYPNLPALAPEVGTVPAALLGAAITDCRRAAAMEDDVVVALTGIRLVGTADGLQLVATNRFVAVDCHLDWDHQADLKVLPVARMLDEACKGLLGTVHIGAEGGLLSLSDDCRAVTMRQLDAKFPDLDRAFDAVGTPTLEVTVEGADLIEAAQRTGRLADDAIPVRLDIEASSISLSVDAIERGDGAEQIDCEATGEGHATFGPRYLADGLAAMPPGLVRLGVSTTGKSTIIHPLDDDGSRRALVMPKRGANA